MQQLEGSAGTGQAGSEQGIAAQATVATSPVANRARYQKGALLIGVISIPASWTDPQNTSLWHSIHLSKPSLQQTDGRKQK